MVSLINVELFVFCVMFYSLFSHFLLEFAAPIIDSIMLATVAGTFVYVGATEVIPEEWEEQDHKWKKFFALMGGIISIFGITQYTMTLEGY